MSGKLKDEIQQGKAFRSAEEEALLNVLRTADYLERGLSELFRRFELSGTQYNVLRILRGAGEHGLSCQECAARMITREPDVTRLFDRLEKRALIRRQRSTEDRRVVKTFLTGPGAQVLSELDAPVEELNKQQMRKLTPQDLARLIELLEKIRGT
jgi:DNA-binding MarR family transcriptional regulator